MAALLVGAMKERAAIWTPTDAGRGGQTIRWWISSEELFLFLFYLLRSEILPGFENPQRANVVIATAREDKAA